MNLGAFVTACNIMIEYVNSIATIEARALKEGLILACQVGCAKMIINFDCMEVARVMHDGGFPATKTSTIHDECVFLACNFVHLIIEYCPREGNNVAPNWEPMLRDTRPVTRVVLLFPVWLMM